mmetsp:Transcript_108/g.398  ORF Transcript_108/g.398 Transcript_108/m.398 type:complete len:211 (-) Transcript_108:338-970(-)
MREMHPKRTWLRPTAKWVIKTSRKHNCLKKSSTHSRVSLSIFHMHSRHSRNSPSQHPGPPQRRSHRILRSMYPLPHWTTMMSLRILTHTAQALMKRSTTCAHKTSPLLGSPSTFKRTNPPLPKKSFSPHKPAPLRLLRWTPTFRAIKMQTNPFQGLTQSESLSEILQSARIFAPHTSTKSPLFAVQMSMPSILSQKSLNLARVWKHTKGE